MGLATRTPKFAAGLQPGITFRIKVDGVMGYFKKIREICSTRIHVGLRDDGITSKMQICETNWTRRIVGGTRADKRRMDELRRVDDVKERIKIKNKLTRSR